MQYDLIIVGGGLVGAGLAASLEASGLQIALIDARLPKKDDPRLFALHSGSCHFLKNLRLWPQVAEVAAPIHQVHVSHQGRFGSVRLNREDVDLPALGHVIPACYIESALHDKVMSLKNVTLYRPATVIKLAQAHQKATLVLRTEEGEKTLHSPLVMAADGTESTIRAQLMLKTDVFDYDQSALVTRIALKRSHQQIAYERFTNRGAIAMLPLLGEECATIWTGDNADINALMALSEQDFLCTLQEEFGYRLGRLETMTKRHLYPLRKVRAEKAVDQCVMLLGNAAHTLHPIAAQGFNLALYEVAFLSETILKKVAIRESFTSLDLQQLSQQLQKQQALSLGVSHRLAKLFGNNSLLMGLAVQLGMMGLEVATPIKKKFIEGLIGKTGRVPRLLLSTKEY